MNKKIILTLLTTIVLTCVSLSAEQNTQAESVAESSEEMQIKLRGSSPFFIVDGVERSEEYIRTLDPNMLESVAILKDHSSAPIYSANGVILVATKAADKKWKNYVDSANRANNANRRYSTNKKSRKK